MTVKQGDLSLLQHPASQELLHSKIPARLAYVWTDGTPRVVPIWFHWNGREIVMGTPPKAPKLKALARNPKVSLTIDDNDFPHKVLLIRGTARLETVDGIVPEYAAAAERYFEPAVREAWMAQLRTRVSTMVRIAITPEWVGLLDFQTRFPSAISALKHVGPDALLHFALGRAGERSSPSGFVFQENPRRACPAGRGAPAPTRSHVSRTSYSPSFSKNRQIDSIPR